MAEASEPGWHFEGVGAWARQTNGGAKVSWASTKIQAAPILMNIESILFVIAILC